MFNLLVIAGHGQGDSGAVGNGYKESELNRDLANLVTSLGNTVKGLKVTLFDPSINMYKYLKAGNKFDFTPYDYVLELHFNSAVNKKARGSMIIINDKETGDSVEKLIINKLVTLGSKKTRTSTGVVRCPSVYGSSLLVNSTCIKQGVSHGLLETCFISNIDDVQWYINKRVDIATYLLFALIEGFGIVADTPSSTPADSNQNENKLFRVQLGAFSSRVNADKLANELKAKNYSAIVKEVEV